MNRFLMLATTLLMLGLMTTPATHASPSLDHDASPYDGGIVFSLDPQGIKSARLVIENAWTGYQWVEFPYRDDPGYTVDWSTAELAPFTELRYHWEGTREDLEPFWTEVATVEAADVSQDWHRLDGERVSVFWYDQPDDYGQRALAVAEAQLKRLTEDLGGGIPARARVVIYQSQEDYGTTGSRSGEARARYGVTVQWPCRCDDDYLFRVTIPHELTHLWLWPRRNDTPDWFREGLAVWSEPHDHAEQQLLISRIAPRNELYSWDALQYRSYRDAEDMQRWYAQAWGMVDYLDRHHDLQAVFDYLREQPHGEFEYAIRAATGGMNSSHLLQAWRVEAGAPQREVRDNVDAIISEGSQDQDINWTAVAIKLLLLAALQVYRWRLNHK